MKPVRPRFSIRTLAIVVTLMCVYFAAWEATKRNGIREVIRITDDGTSFYYRKDMSSPAPFVIRVVEGFEEVTVFIWLGGDRYHRIKDGRKYLGFLQQVEVQRWNQGR